MSEWTDLLDAGITDIRMGEVISGVANTGKDKAGIEETLNNSASMESVTVATSIVTDIELLEGNGIDITSGINIVGDGGAWLACNLRAIEGVTSVTGFMKVWTSSQKQLLYFTQVSYDEYTLHSQVNIPTGEINLIEADFPEGVTHYAMQCVPASSSTDPYLTELSQLKVNYEKELGEVTDNTVLDRVQASLIYPLVSIVDTSKIMPNSSFEYNTGRALHAVSVNSRVTDFCEIVLDVEYVTTGYITSAVLYDVNKEYLEKLTVIDNGSFTVNNPDGHYVRIGTPNADLIVAIASSLNYSEALRNLPAHTGVREVLPDTVYQYPLKGDGDSLMAKYWSVEYTRLTGNSALYDSYGGMDSSLIREQFINGGNKDTAFNIIWIGQNNLSEPRTIMSDIRLMVESLSHRRFLILSHLTGADTTIELQAEQVAEVEIIENAIRKAYPLNSLILRDAILNGAYDKGGVILTSPFIQPVAGGSVDIEVSDVVFMNYVNNYDDSSTWVPAQNIMQIGFENDYDLYEMQSYTTNGDGVSGTITATLVADTEYRVSEGETVANFAMSGTPSGGSTSIDYTKYLEVCRHADTVIMEAGGTPTTFRVDEIHPNEKYGGACIGRLVANAVDSISER